MKVFVNREKNSSKSTQILWRGKQEGNLANDDYRQDCGNYIRLVDRQPYPRYLMSLLCLGDRH